MLGFANSLSRWVAELELRRSSPSGGEICTKERHPAHDPEHDHGEHDSVDHHGRQPREEVQPEYCRGEKDQHAEQQCPKRRRRVVLVSIQAWNTLLCVHVATPPGEWRSGLPPRTLFLRPKLEDERVARKRWGSAKRRKLQGLVRFVTKNGHIVFETERQLAAEVPERSFRSVGLSSHNSRPTW